MTPQHPTHWQWIRHDGSWFALAWISLLAVLTLCPPILEPCMANDLDDGIAIDDAISKHDTIKLDINNRFIMQNAKAKGVIKKRDLNKMTSPNTVVQGGVYLENVRKTGDIYVIYNGKNNVAVSGK